MKDYRIGILLGILYCRYSNLMRIGKPIRVTQYTPKRKKCPNCGKMLIIKVLITPEKKTRILITQGK